MMFYAPPERHDQITVALSGLRRVEFSFDRAGTQIVFYQPTQ
jgi:D-glycero-alpha-D-manno-heptose-7-phosphate kinase